MHWPEDLLVGGVRKNRTGHIVQASALQSIVQLMGEQEMFDYYQHTYKVHNLDWNVDKARLVLEAWQRKFSKRLQHFSDHLEASSHAHHNEDAFSVNVSSSSTSLFDSDSTTTSSPKTSPSTSTPEFHIFTSTSLADIMRNFSDVNFLRLLAGYGLMLLYAGYSLSRWSDKVTKMERSQSFLGMMGVIFIALAAVAGLGLCSLLGLPFNASTTQTIPFLALGLGMDNMFLLAHTYASDYIVLNVPVALRTAEVLKQTGMNMMLTSLARIISFLAASIIPIPALRVFSLQSAILLVFISFTVIVLFPALASVDLRFRNSYLARNALVHGPDSILVTVLLYVCCCGSGGRRRNRGQAEVEDPYVEEKLTSLNEELVVDGVGDGEEGAEVGVASKQKHRRRRPRFRLTIQHLISFYYIPMLQAKSSKFFVITTFLASLMLGLAGIHRVQDGLELTDIVPRHTNEHRFLHYQRRYFSFFNVFAVTKGNFDYPNNQKLVYEYQRSFTSVAAIIKNDDGGLPEFWLSMMRDWLRGLQTAFDRDWDRGAITREQWYSNASDDGILAYKLLVQTGRVDNPVDKSLVHTARLVDEMGVINPKAFYNYLTAWASNDALAFSASQASLRPEPRHWIHVPQEVELKIPKSQPLVYSQIPFHLNNIRTTQEIVATIEEIRTICTRFESRNLPNFPTGIPFTYWEQYVRLRFYLISALVITLSAIFLMICIFLVNLWTAAIFVFTLASIVVQLFGAMGWLGIKLSAIPAVMLIVATGMGVDMIAHLVISFLTSVGDRNRRMAMSLEHMFSPVVHGILSTAIGVAMLATSEFDFIVV